MDVVTSFGLRFPVDGTIIDDKLARKLAAQRYEAREVRWLEKIVRRRERVLEMGAGIGFISGILSKRLGVREIMAVEANPLLIPVIRQVHELNGITNVDLRNVVCFADTAPMPDRATFYAAQPFWSGALVEPNGVPSKPVPVPTTRLSALIAEFDPTMIVCDIEGAETEVFTSVDFGNVDRLFIETHRRKYGGVGMRKLFHAMHVHDFAFQPKFSGDGQVAFQKLLEPYRGQPFP